MVFCLVSSLPGEAGPKTLAFYSSLPLFLKPYVLALVIQVMGKSDEVSLALKALHIGA